MELKMIIAGFGGQGVMVTGKLLGYAASAHGKRAMFLPQYGPEQRGGTASCTVILSDEEIGSPIVGECDVLMVFNQPSLEKFLPRLKKGGLLFANSSLCDTSAVNVDAEILLIDEILSVGDEHFQNKCYDKMRDLKNQGKTMVFVTHSMQTVKQLCDRAVWLCDGKIKMDGATEEVVDEYIKETR